MLSKVLEPISLLFNFHCLTIFVWFTHLVKNWSKLSSLVQIFTGAEESEIFFPEDPSIIVKENCLKWKHRPED